MASALRVNIPGSHRVMAMSMPHCAGDSQHAPMRCCSDNGICPLMQAQLPTTRALPWRHPGATAKLSPLGVPRLLARSRIPPLRPPSPDSV